MTTASKLDASHHDDDHHEGDIIPIIPPDTQLKYLAEGAANVVLTMIIARRQQPPSPSTSTTELDSYGPNTPPPTAMEPLSHDPIFFFDHKLLRLRKEIPSRVSNAQALRFFRSRIAPAATATAAAAASHHSDSLKKKKKKKKKDPPPSFPGPENLVSQDLVRVPRETVDAVNRHLRELEGAGKRPEKRRGVYVTTEDPFGILVEDMRRGVVDDFPSSSPPPPLPRTATTMTTTTTTTMTTSLIEFKPKWLIPSHNAPRDARRCRTCALRDLRNSERRERMKDAHAPVPVPVPVHSPPQELLPAVFCPLDLVSDDDDDDDNDDDNDRDPRALLAAARAITRNDAALSRTLARALTATRILHSLRAVQEYTTAEARRTGTPEDFALSMTWKDCTVFVRVQMTKIPPKPSSVGGANDDDDGNDDDGIVDDDVDHADDVVEIKLGDLDLKDSRKLEKWVGLEKRLVEEGWYAGKGDRGLLLDGGGEDGGGDMSTMYQRCRLDRRR